MSTFAPPNPREELERIEARVKRGDEYGTEREAKLQRVAVELHENGIPLFDAEAVREQIRLRGGQPYGTVIAIIWDGWRNRHRVLLSGGKCACCRRKTGYFNDGENDPRGSLGDNAASPMDAHDEVSEEYEYDELIVSACFNCQNEEPRYRQLQRIIQAEALRQPPKTRLKGRGE